LTTISVILILISTIPLMFFSTPFRDTSITVCPKDETVKAGNYGAGSADGAGYDENAIPLPATFPMIRRSDAMGDIPYTFFSSVNFTSIDTVGESLWAMGDHLILEHSPSTGDMRIRDSEKGLTENISRARNNCHAIYLQGEEDLFRYDIGKDVFENIELPGSVKLNEVLDYFPLVGEGEDGGVSEGIVLVEEDRLVTLDSDDHLEFNILNQESTPGKLGEYRWIDGFLDVVFVGFSDGILVASHEERIGMDDIKGGDAGSIYGISLEGDKIALRLALAREGDVFGYTYASGPEGSPGELKENGTLWDAGMEGDIESILVSGDTILLRSGDRLLLREGTDEHSLDIPGLEDTTIVGEEVFALVKGELCTASGGEMEEMKININAPAPGLRNMNAGDGILVAGSNSSISILPGGAAPARWINSETILGTHLKRPVQCLDEEENVWVAQSSELFRGVLSGEDVSWNRYLVNNIRSPLSIAAREDLLLVQNESALVLFNTTTRTDEALTVPGTDAGRYEKSVGDEFEECFWVLCEKGVLKLAMEANGSLNTSFYSMAFLPGNEVIDVATSENVLWILTDEGLARYYKPGDEWWNYTESPDMLAAELKTLYSRGHEVFVGGKELYYMDEWSGVNGFMPLSFDEGELTGITSVDGRNFRDDDTGEIYILDSGGIRIYDTSRSNWQSLTTSNGLASNDIRQVIKDEQTGDIWVAAYGGVTKYEPNSSSFIVITADDGLTNNFVYTAHADDHGIWLGTDGGGVNIIRRDGEIETLTTEDGLVADDVLKIKSFEKDEYWFCTDAGVTLYDGESGETTNFQSPKNIAGDWAWDIDILEGHAFIATDKGITELIEEKGQWKTSERYYHATDMPDNNVFAVDVFRHNHKRFLWAGTAGGAVCYNLETGQWLNLDQNVGMKNTRIRDVFYDGEKVWVATGAGAYLFTPDGEYINSYTREDGLVQNMVESFSRYGDVMYIATGGGFSMFREDSITNTLLPRFIRTPGLLPDISIDDYLINVSYSAASETIRLRINVSLKGDIGGICKLFVGAVEPLDSFDVVTALYMDRDPPGLEPWSLVEIDGFEFGEPGRATVELEVAGIPRSMASDDVPAEKILDDITLYFRIDPDGTWIEESENNNIVITSVELTDIGEEPEEIERDEGDSWWFLVIYFLFLLLIISFMKVLNVRRRRSERLKKALEEVDEEK